MIPHHMVECRRHLLDFSGRFVIRCGKHGDNALFRRVPSLPVAAAGCLRNLIKTGFGTPDPWKIEVDTGFHQRGRDEPARITACQSLSDGPEYFPAMDCVLPGCQMDNAFKLGLLRLIEQLQGVFAAVEDDQTLGVIPQSRQQILIAHVSGPFDRRAPQFFRQTFRRGRQFTAFKRQTHGLTVGEVSLVEGGLCRGAQNNRAAVISGQFVERHEPTVPRDAAAMSGLRPG